MDQALKYCLRNNACYIHVFSFQTRQTNHLLYKVKNVLSVSLAMLAESLWCCLCIFTRKLTKERVSNQNNNLSQFTHPLLGILQIHHPPPTTPNLLFVSSLTYRATDPAVPQFLTDAQRNSEYVVRMRKTVAGPSSLICTRVSLPVLYELA